MTEHRDGEPPHGGASEAAAFDALSRSVQTRFDAVLAAGGRLFEVDAPDLGPVFLDHLPPERRPYHTCSFGPAEFLLRLHDEIPRRAGVKRDAILWRAVAAAPPGFCTPRGAMIGTLLEDIAAGLDFATVKARFDAKMHPLQYQRPQAPPKAGTIAQAERLFAQLGLEPALRRRSARLDDIPTIWRPCGAAPEVVASSSPRGNGIFGHLRTKATGAADGSLDMPAQAVTWAKFAREVLPEAQRMWVFAAGRMTFCGLVTAVDPAAPPLLQWDRPEARNPVSLYLYVNGSPPANWGLPEGSANGLLVGQDGDHRIRVESAVGTACYRIDRWE
ncbi:hypothetical protein [Methylobacterium variabile]|uniref:hypothetical protein n=1 Tax=Methylobacterium variabile TaxID=298794 RepID=UPI00069D2117|nr:hypothetical protein [Methylobacterium variabile]